MVLTSAGEHSARAPVAETALLGGWLLAEAGLPVPAGPLVAADGAGAVSLARVPDGWLVRGRLPRVGWGRVAQRVVVLTGAVDAAGDTELAVALRPEDVTVTPGTNVAGEPRDDLTVDTVILDTVADGTAVAEVAAAPARRCGGGPRSRGSC